MADSQIKIRFYIGDDVILPNGEKGFITGVRDIRQHLVGMHEFQALEFLAKLRSQWGAKSAEWWQECTVKSGGTEYRFINAQLRLSPKKEGKQEW